MAPQEVREFVDIFINEKYLCKSDILYRVPSSLNIDEFWNQLVAARRENGVSLPLLDQNSLNFWYCDSAKIRSYLEFIDEYGKDSMFYRIDDALQKNITKEAIIDEAFHSSVIEGAISTRKRAKEMIENNLKPVDVSEQMIINNFKALEYILENISHPIDEEITLDIYRILTNNTLDEDDKVEKYRNDLVYIWDVRRNESIYTAPSHDQVQELMNSLFEFMKEDSPTLHPVIIACIFHFYFVYIHPFFDGNGRTARALSYMYLIQKGYDFFKFFSISSVIHEKKNKYYQSIQNVEDYQSDLTYFIDFYAEMLATSITEMMNKIEKEFGNQLLRRYLDWKNISLSKRQLRLLEYFIKGEKNFVFIEYYQKKYRVSYNTARNDLNELVDLGFLKKDKQGRKNIYKMCALDKARLEIGK